MVLKVLLILMSMLHMHKTHITQVFHALKFFLMLKLFVVNLNLYILLSNLVFLLLILKDFNMHTGQPSSSSTVNENISCKIVLNISNNKYVFSALNISNNFATIDYDAHINTKKYYTINHVFRSMTVQELNTLHRVCELERCQLLTILAMSV